MAAAAAGASGQGKAVLMVVSPNSIYNVTRLTLKQEIRAETQEIVLQGARDPAFVFAPDLVVAVGGPAFKWAQERVHGTPLLACGFLYQLNPELYQSVAGVPWDLPLSAYVQTVRDAFPQKRRLGLLFNPSRNPDTTRAARKIAEELSVQIEALPIEKERDIGGALEKLRQKNMEVFVMTMDPLLMTAETLRFLADFCVKNRVAFVVPSKLLLNSGGVLSVEADEREVGRLTAQLANRILQNDKEAASPRIHYSNREVIGVNLKLSKVLGLDIAPAVLAKAEFVNKE